jgi:alkylation response protein AidB-like acyl-CoA dehydrogenase
MGWATLTRWHHRIHDHSRVQGVVASVRRIVCHVDLDMDDRTKALHAKVTDFVASRAMEAVVPRVVQQVVDRALQVHGAAGVRPDTPLPHYTAEARYLRIGDGPDEVHVEAVARRELRADRGRS